MSRPQREGPPVWNIEGTRMGAAFEAHLRRTGFNPYKDAEHEAATLRLKLDLIYRAAVRALSDPPSSDTAVLIEICSIIEGSK